MLSSGNKLPWLYCDNGWNTDECLPYSFLASTNLTPTTEVPNYSTLYNPPAVEYFENRSTLQKILCNLVTWVLILLPLIQGAKSLLKSFFVGFPLLLLLNTLLLLRAISLSPIEYRFMLRPDFDCFTYPEPYPWLDILRISLGVWFIAEYGCLFVVGKYIEESIFPIPHVLTAAAVCFLLNILNSLKVAAFISNYRSLEGSAPYKTNPYKYWDGLHSSAVVLSQQPASIFWLLANFTFLLGCSLPSLSFAVETVAISLAEFLPGCMAHRTKFPQNLILTVALGIIGFGLSVVRLFVDVSLWANSMYENLHFVFCMVIFLTITILVPMSLSKVVNAGRETLFDFVRRQGSQSWAKARQRLTFMMVIIAGVAALLMQFFLCNYPKLYLFQTLSISYLYPWRDYAQVTLGLVTLIVVSLIVVIVAVVQIILYCRQGSRYPCCLSVGKRKDPERDLEAPTKFPSNQSATKCQCECRCFGCACSCK